MNAESPGAVAGKRPHWAAPFDFARFFEGRKRAIGIFEDRFGRLRARFSVDMTGTWRGSTLELDELFVYDTGEVEKRCWIVHPVDVGSFRAVCQDALSDAHGRNLPGLAEMTYKFPLPVLGRPIGFDFLDRLYDMGEGRALNRVRISKWGIAIGELTLCFNRA